MSAEKLHMSSRRVRALSILLLQVSTAALLTACGGVGDGGARSPTTAVIRHARFNDDTVSGLRFHIAGVGEGTTGGDGEFQFVEDRPVVFMAGGAADHILIGTATISSKANHAVSFSLQHLEEVRAPNGDIYLANLLRLLALLDSNSDSRDGFQIEAAANSAIGMVVDGTRTLDFAAGADSFANDSTIVALARKLDRTLIGSDEALAGYQRLFRR